MAFRPNTPAIHDRFRRRWGLVAENLGSWLAKAHGLSPGNAFIEQVSESAPMAVESLRDLPEVDPDTAARLRDAGFESLRSIAYAPPDAVADAADLREETAHDIVRTARDAAGYQSGTDFIAQRDRIGRITTGVQPLDDLLGGGVPPRTVTELSGPPAAGKSQVVHQLAVTVQLPVQHGGLDGGALYVDSEKTFRPERIRDIVRGLPASVRTAAMTRRGIDGSPGDEDALAALVESVLDRIHIATANTATHQLLLTETAEAIVADRATGEVPIRLLCVDSLTAHFRAEYAGDERLLERQQKLNKHLQDLRRIAQRHDLAVVGTNQVATDPEAIGDDSLRPVGGNILGHVAAIRLALETAEDDERTIHLVDAPHRPPGTAQLRIGSAGVRRG